MACKTNVEAEVVYDDDVIQVEQIVRVNLFMLGPFWCSGSLGGKIGRQRVFFPFIYDLAS